MISKEMNPEMGKYRSFAEKPKVAQGGRGKKVEAYSKEETTAFAFVYLRFRVMHDILC